MVQLIVAQLNNILGVVGLQHEAKAHSAVVCFTTIRIGRCTVPMGRCHLHHCVWLSQLFYGTPSRIHAAVTNLDVLVHYCRQ